MSRQRIALSIVFALAMLLALLGGCTLATPTAQPTAKSAAPTQAPAAAPTAGQSGVSGSLTVTGSTTVQPLAEKLATAFTAANPKAQISVTGGGSSVGVKSAGEGAAEIGMVSREVKSEEFAQYKDLESIVIAWDGIALVVNADVTVSDLTVEQTRDIFSGKITNWQAVGGANKPIVVVSREEGSGTRTAFEELVMGKDAVITENAILQPSNGAVRTTVSTTPDAIAYLSFGYLDSSVKTLKVGGVDATPANAVSKTYSIVRPLGMLTKGEPTGLAKAWLGFILSDAGQKIVVEEGYLAVP